MRQLRHIYLLPLLALLASCALFNLESPDTFNERLAYGYSQQTAVLQSITTQVNAGEMTSADGEKFVGLAENAKDITDGARDAMRGGDASTAEGKLRLALNILVELNDYMRSN